MRRHKAASFLIAGLLLCLPLAVSAAPSSTKIGHPGAAASYPEQSAVANKGSFAVISALSPSVRKALKATDLAAAGKLIGKSGAFQGTVAKVYSPRGHDIAILDFADNYRSALTAIVKPASYAKLPNLDGLVGKRVLVTGRFTAYEGRPQIEITSPGQVRIIR